MEFLLEIQKSLEILMEKCSSAYDLIETFYAAHHIYKLVLPIAIQLNCCALIHFTECRFNSMELTMQDIKYEP